MDEDFRKIMEFILRQKFYEGNIMPWPTPPKGPKFNPTDALHEFYKENPMPWPTPPKGPKFNPTDALTAQSVEEAFAVYHTALEVWEKAAGVPDLPVVDILQRALSAELHDPEPHYQMDERLIWCKCERCIEDRKNT